jgi:hypothetical protein
MVPAAAADRPTDSNGVVDAGDGDFRLTPTRTTHLGMALAARAPCWTPRWLHTTLLSEGVGHTVEIKINYLKAVTEASGTLMAGGTVVKAGSRIGSTEANITDASGNLVATATSTLLIFDLHSPAKRSSTNGNHS